MSKTTLKLPSNGKTSLVSLAPTLLSLSLLRTLSTSAFAVARRHGAASDVRCRSIERTFRMFALCFDQAVGDDVVVVTLLVFSAGRQAQRFPRCRCAMQRRRAQGSSRDVDTETGSASETTRAPAWAFFFDLNVRREVKVCVSSNASSQSRPRH